MTTTTRIRPGVAATPTPKRAATVLDEADLWNRVRAILNRWPCAGLAVGVVVDGRLAFFHGEGLADIASSTPITEDTVFRIGSITKTMTAVAVMQLWEQGLVDLDAPANEYLRAYRLVPASSTWRPATIRHLLTHTAGIPDVLDVRDLLHPSWGPFDARPPIHSVPVGGVLPPLAEYYRDGLQVVVEPGTRFSYSNHGFATLGQIVEDVSGVPVERFMRERIFEPLGMTHTDLVRSERVLGRLATGYVFRRRGPEAIADREWIGGSGGAVYSTTADLARYASALLGGGRNEHGSVLRSTTVGMMMEPHYAPDRRLGGMGLGFFLAHLGDHRVVWHEGLMPGFNSQLLMAPDDGLAVIGLTNGSFGAFTWMPDEFNALARSLLNTPEEQLRSDVPNRPEIWPQLCGRYGLPARIADLRGRVMMAGGAEVFVRGGRLALRVLAPLPTLYRGFPLVADDEHDPYVFRLDLSPLGWAPLRLVFDLEGREVAQVVHTDLGGQPISFYRRPAPTRRTRLAAGMAALGAVAAVGAVRRVRARKGEQQ